MLSLETNALTGMIPSEIELLNQLKYIYLYSNSLSGSIPFSFCEMDSSNVPRIVVDCDNVICHCCRYPRCGHYLMPSSSAFPSFSPSIFNKDPSNYSSSSSVPSEPSLSPISSTAVQRPSITIGASASLYPTTLPSSLPTAEYPTRVPYFSEPSWVSDMFSSSLFQGSMVPSSSASLTPETNSPTVLPSSSHHPTELPTFSPSQQPFKYPTLSPSTSQYSSVSPSVFPPDKLVQLPTEDSSILP
eukprot:CAMPEP_0194238020 /NCGR_PEP_ID=MMETSP0158-20130606/4869_1 /TAXON_ID=33649 /ORGANISM="Thalassionema nitzschioides, Strain L26-B" /LENGTH=243 /DNA_ID=CAMNT_0038972181 /DNA_START=57 /DNA_END=785 /DNA_ORIENTATION=-